MKIVGRKPGKRIARFYRDEDGSFVLLSIYLLIVMLLVGGIGVDIIRHDYERLRMQGTLDAAILAAADLDQTLDPEAVVRDYFEKAGMENRLGEIEIVQNANSRTVSAEAATDVDMMFMNALGRDRIPARVAATAREEDTDIEIALVLDISGSMGSYDRIENLQDAATAFVETMLPEDGTSGGLNVSISIVPYTRQTAVPPLVLDAMTLESDLTHENSRCIEFTNADYRTSALPFGANRKQAGHLDFATSWEHDHVPGSGTLDNEDGYTAWNLRCRNDAGAIATVMSDDRDHLIAQISKLSPDGGTRAGVGMKWAMGFLDPAFRPVTQSLIAAGNVNAAMAPRPYDYGRDNTLKAIILMTDGDNNGETISMKDGANGENLSDIYAWTDAAGVTHWSVNDREKGDHDADGISAEDYYIPALDVWQESPVGGAAASQVPWRDVWARFSLQRHAYWFRQRQYDDWNAFNWWLAAPLSYQNLGDPDRNMLDVCDAAKTNGVAVYTVGLEVTEDNSEQLRRCASTDNNFFYVDGREIVRAFQAIANSITQLRLVQ